MGRKVTIEDVLRTVKVTDKYVAFWGGVFSNFCPCKIKEDRDWWDKPIDEVTFSSSEQYFMWLKATWFNDQEIADKILQAKTPKEAKALGREVRGFDEKEWEEAREAAMWNAVLAKFRQNEQLKAFLLADEFKNKHFVEASPVDKIWGIGMDMDNPLMDDESNWKGLNLLGKTLDKVRRFFLNEDKYKDDKDFQ